MNVWGVVGCRHGEPYERRATERSPPPGLGRASRLDPLRGGWVNLEESLVPGGRRFRTPLRFTCQARSGSRTPARSSWRRGSPRGEVGADSARSEVQGRARNQREEVGALCDASSSTHVMAAFVRALRGAPINRGARALRPPKQCVLGVGMAVNPDNRTVARGRRSCTPSPLSEWVPFLAGRQTYPRRSPGNLREGKRAGPERDSCRRSLPPRGRRSGPSCCNRESDQPRFPRLPGHDSSVDRTARGGSEGAGLVTADATLAQVRRPLVRPSQSRGLSNPALAVIAQRLWRSGRCHGHRSRPSSTRR